MIHGYFVFGSPIIPLKVEDKEIKVLLDTANFSLAGMELFHFCKIILERHKNIIKIEKTF